MDSSMTKVRDIASRLRDKLLDLKKGINLPSPVTDMASKLAGDRTVERAFNVQDRLPDFDLVSPDGKKLSLATFAKSKPVVLVFFRGAWCPWCSALMQHLIEATELLRGLGAEIVAVSPMTDVATKKLVEERKIPFPVYGGPSGKALIKQFGLGFNPLPNYEGLFQHLGVDLKETYGEDADVMIPIPASYVINTQAQLVYAFLEEDFRVRGGIDEIAATIVRSQRDRTKYLSKVRVMEGKQSTSILRAIFGRKKASSSSPQERKPRALYANKSFSGSSRVSDKSSSDAFAFCLESDDFREAFAAYLDSTYCTENLLFYSEATVFAHEYERSAPKTNETRSREVSETFVQPGAPLEVNIDDQTRASISSRVVEGKVDATLFEPAAQEVRRLMETDSFPKWKRTKEYAALWERSGKNLLLIPSTHYLSAEEAASSSL